MPVTKTISENGHVLRYDISDPWEILNLLSLFPDDIRYRTDAPYRVHTVIDVTRMHRVPTGWLNARNAPGLTHPNSGQFVVVGITLGPRRLLDVIVKLARATKVVFYDTDEKAFNYLRDVIAKEAPVGTNH